MNSVPSSHLAHHLSNVLASLEWEIAEAAFRRLQYGYRLEVDEDQGTGTVVCADGNEFVTFRLSDLMNPPAEYVLA